MTDTSELEASLHELETLGQGLLDLGLAMEGCNPPSRGGPSPG